MVADPVIHELLAYLPPDRAAAVLLDAPLPPLARGAVLFSDISGFTPLTEAVIQRYGARRGGEEFTDRLNAVYDALITQVVRFGGSIVGFAGDAMVVWFAEDEGRRAVTTALAMQRAMAQFAQVALPDGEQVTLSMKVAVAAGLLRRFQAGDPCIQNFDVIAGRVMEVVSECEGLARSGEVVVDAATAQALGAALTVREWRSRPGDPTLAPVAIVSALATEEPPLAPAVLACPPDATERLRAWLVPEVAQRILAEQNVFLTELRPAAAVFARFSGIDFEHDPAAPAQLDAYVRWLQRIIARLEGVLVQLTIGEKGSYFYAAWGAPIAHGDDTMRALTAALEIVQPPSEIAAFVRTTQIGITRGTMRTGAYGNPQRRTYGVLGDETNLAARLMAKAGPNEIWVSARAARRQQDFFNLEPLPPVTVKGKRDPIAVLRLVGRKRTSILGTLGAIQSSLPLFGRERERSLLVERLQRAATGAGQLIAFTAEAGVGKTRLLTEALREATAQGFTAFAGDCPVLAREASYSVWVPIWRSFFRVGGETEPTVVLARVEEELSAIDPELPARAPLLGPLLNVALPDNELTRTLDPKTRRLSLGGLIVECLRHRSRAGPVLLLLEECHWIDEASRQLLADVTQAIARFPVAIVLAHRPVQPGEVLGPNEAALEYVTVVELGDLAPADSRQLVESKLEDVFGPGAPVPERLVELITSRAGGNPFFIEEVANLLKQRRAELSDARALDLLELPNSLHSLVLGRIDQMTEDTQTTLKVASVIGRHFRAAMVFGVHPLERSRISVPQHLSEMRERDVALPEPVDGEEAYLFKHAVIQEVAYESLPYALRTRIHEAIGTYLEGVAGENLRPWIDLLAFHFDRSPREDKKRHYLLAAGEAAREAYTLGSAISYYERALPLLTAEASIDVLTRLGEVLELAGRWNDAFERYRQARAAAEQVGTPTQRATIAGTIGDLHRKRGGFAEAAQWLQRARQENVGNESGVALMLHLEGTLAAQSGDFPRATSLFQRALALRVQLGEEANAAKTLNNLGIVARAQGDVDTALTYYEQSLTIRRRVNDRREVANSLNNLGFARRYRKEFDRARELLEESVKMNRAVGDRWSTGNALGSLAQLALDLGDAPLAARCLQESMSINLELGDRRALAFLLEAFGQLGRLNQDPATALLYFAAARALRESVGAPLEPADAEKVAKTVDEARAALPAAEAAQAEAEGASLPLAALVDRAGALFT